MKYFEWAGEARPAEQWADEQWPSDEPVFEEAFPAEAPVAYPRRSVQSPPKTLLFMLAGGLLLGMFMAIFAVKGEPQPVAAAAERPLQPTAVPTLVPTVQATAVAALPADSGSIIVPYDDYVITQGLHGFSYGHMAIDIAGGKGATIFAPIDGEITERSIDEWGNTILVIENERYQIMFLHGNYTADVGEQVRQGQVIGTEGNNGYTKDMYGNLCYNRDCGYHTHLNIFDKQLQANVDPFQVLENLEW